MTKGKIKYDVIFPSIKRLAVTETSRLIRFNDPLKNSAVLKRIKRLLKTEKSQSNLCFKFPTLKKDCASRVRRTKLANKNISLA